MNTGKGNGSGFRSILAGALIALLAMGLLSALPAAAGIGDPLLLGLGTNNASKPTTVFNKANATFRILNRSADGVPLVLESEQGRPPLKVNQPVRVVNLNADLLDGRNFTDFLPADGKAANAHQVDGYHAHQLIRTNYKHTAIAPQKYDGLLLREGITAPGPGHLVVYGSVDAERPLGIAGDNRITCKLKVDATYVPGSRSDVNLKPGHGRTSCSGSGVIPIPAGGDLTFGLFIRDRMPGTVLWEANIWAIFIPFGPGTL